MKLFFESSSERPKQWSIIRYVDSDIPEKDREDFVSYYDIEDVEQIPEKMTKAEAVKYAKSQGYKVKRAQSQPGTGRWGAGQIVIE